MKATAKVQNKPLNKMAVIALVLALLLLSFVAAVLGHVAVSQIKKSGERGRSAALAAIVLGWSTTLLGALLVANPYGFGVAVGGLFG